MDANRKMWNERQQALRQALTKPGDQQAGLDLCLRQHARVHAAEVSAAAEWSCADEVLEGVSEACIRRVPPKGEHSIAWALWHIARIEDMTMNVLVAGGRQIFHEEGWQARLRVEMIDTGSAMDTSAVAAFSAQVDTAALLAYRSAVGRATQAILHGLKSARLKEKVAPDRIERIRAEGGVAAAAGWLLDYWGGLTIAQLLLMPPTRHNFVHLNEILHLPQKCR